MTFSFSQLRISFVAFDLTSPVLSTYFTMVGIMYFTMVGIMYFIMWVQAHKKSLQI